MKDRNFLVDFGIPDLNIFLSDTLWVHSHYLKDVHSSSSVVRSRVECLVSVSTKIADYYPAPQSSQSYDSYFNCFD